MKALLKIASVLFLTNIGVVFATTDTIYATRYALRIINSQEDAGRQESPTSEDTIRAGEWTRGPAYYYDSEVLLDFDLSDIPSGATIDSVDFGYKVQSLTSDPSQTNWVRLYKNTRAWSGIPKYYDLDSSTAWPGGDLLETDTCDTTGWHDFISSSNFKSLVEGWLDDESSNKGVILTNMTYYQDWYINNSRARIIVHHTGGVTDTTWNYSKRITLNTSSSGANVSGDVYDFPVLIRLDSSNFNFSTAKSNGEDIRFTRYDNDTTYLAHEIKYWDNVNEEAEIWVKVDTIFGDTITHYLTMHWGNNSASDSSNSGAVFDTTNNYKGVWHLNEGSGNTAIDATYYDYDGTFNGGLPDERDGVITNCQDFDGSGDYISFSDKCNVTSEWSIMFWVKPDSPDNYERIFIQGDDGCASRQFSVHWYDNHIELYSATDGSNGKSQIGSDTLPDAQWSHVVFTYDGSTHKVYVNGDTASSSSLCQYDMSVGGDIYMGCKEGSGNYWTGKLDEVRVINDDRSADWIKLSYENQKTNQTLVEIAPENYQDWYYSKRIYFNTTPFGAGVSNNVEDFPFLVRLNSDNFNFTRQVTYDGHDIRFSDPDGTKLPYEFEQWDITNEQASIWVKVPRINGNSSNDFIIMYWGNYSDSIIDNQESEEVFDNDFAGVWHLHDDFYDATENNYDGSNNGSTDTIGIIADGQRFDGSNDYISLSSGCMVSDTWSLTFWIKPSDPDNYERIFIQGSSGCGSRQVMALWYGNHIEFRTTTTGSNGNPQKATATITDDDSTWSHVVWTYDGSTHTAYVNGVSSSGTVSGYVNVNGYNFIGTSGGTSNFWTGDLDEIRLSGTNRSADWIKLSYENQRPDSKLQLDNEIAIYPIVDGTISNKPNDFEYVSDSLVLRYGEDPGQDTINYALLRFDLSKALELENMGWTLEDVELDLTVNSGVTPIYSAEIDFGMYGNNRFIPQEKQDGYYRWLQDLSTLNGADTIEMDGTFYQNGLGGNLDTSGENWSWLLFNVDEENEKLSLIEIDSITGYAGKQDGSSNVNTYIKTSTSQEAPSDSAWKNNGTGVTVQCSTINDETNQYFSIPLDSICWIWLEVYSASPDSTCHGVWGDIKAHGKKYKSTNLLVYQIKDDGIDTAGLSFTHRASNIPWRHEDLDSLEGLGTEDLEVLFPGHEPLWNRYKGKYRHRSPIFSHTITLPYDSTMIILYSDLLGKEVVKSIQDVTEDSIITLLAVLQDSGDVKVFSSEVKDYNLKPKLKLRYSDSQKLLSWQGRNSNLDFPEDSTITLNNNPSIGDGRYGRVIRFHESNQSATLDNDTMYINYSEGIISFWYQKVLSNGNANDATFFARVKDSSFFKLARIGTSDSMYFWYGDTTESNVIIWVYNDSINNPFDGGQHLIEFGWNKLENDFRLAIDGSLLSSVGQIDQDEDPALWTKDEIEFGKNIDGYLENLQIYSKISYPTNIEIITTDINDNFGYLPHIQSGFNDTVDCIILSPDDLLFKQELERYALRNISMGIRSKVVSIDLINKYYSGSDIQERIRNFLKQAYLKWNPKWLVIGGSNSQIASRKIAFETINGHEVTTDRYYACLEGSWNEDGDRFFSESNDETDLSAELIVSRFPANTWSELRTMIEKSTIAFGLPPYKDQCVTQRDTVLLTGIQMSTDVGEISDGQYYGNQLQNILEKGEYSFQIPVKSYYPYDDTLNDTTDTLESRFNKFLDSLTPMPGLWIHYGHGAADALVIDGIEKEKATWWVAILPKDLEADSTFNRFTTMSHVRIVGCGTSSQDQNSIGRRFLSKPYGGALTYVGASEYSYPNVESQLLIEEISTLADSSVFSWGEIFKKSVYKLTQSSTSPTDIENWVVLTRNFMGDPLLPVRYKNLSSTDTLCVESGETIYPRDNTITVTVKDTNDVPVEGAQVGLVPQKVEFSYSYIDTLDTLRGTLEVVEPYRDYAFSHGITNRYGEVTLTFNARYEDSLVITAIHHDYLPGRLVKGVEEQGVCNKVWIDETRIFEDSCIFEDTLVIEEVLTDGIYQSGERLMLVAKVKSICDTTTEDIDIYLDKMYSDAEDGIYLGEIEGFGDTGFTLQSGEQKSVYFYFFVDSCPVGTNDLVMRITNNKDNDTVFFNVPVTGPKVVPVISYLLDGNNDVIPEGGDSVTMQILFGNKYPAVASKVICELIEDDANVTVSNSKTDTIKVVSASTTALDTNITYSISGGYSEDTNGVIFAKLVVTGENIRTDTIDIDLNPIRGLSFNINSSSVALDYKDGVFLSWNGVKYEEDFGRHSDFLGYVVMRASYDDTNSYHLLTPSAVTAGNYYYDQLSSDDSSDYYRYSVSVVDSSFNCSQVDEITIKRPWSKRLKEGFPIYTGSFSITSPVIADYNKDGLSEIYSVSPRDFSDAQMGRGIGFRGNGQEAVVDGRNDGLLSNYNTSNVVLVDLNNDGYDDAVYTNGNIIIANDLRNKDTLWTTPLDSDSGHVFELEWYCRPVIADITGNGNFEIILYGLDNKPKGGVGSAGGSLYVLNKNGVLLARHNYPDGSGYQHDMVVGNFYVSGEDEELEIILAMRDTLLLFKDLDSASTEFNTVEKKSIGIKDTIEVRSSISVGNCLGSEDSLHVAIYLSKMTKGPTQGELKVVSINRSNGTFKNEIRTGNVSFSNWTLFAGAPAMADLDGDSDKEIIFAGDDTIYVFNVTSSDTLQLTNAIPYGTVPAQRLHPYDYYSQPIIADIDHDDSLEILTTHERDGKIWAFELDGSVCEGYPLKVRGKVQNAINVTDLEGDGIIDLVANDNAGYIYAWSLDTGAIYSQPWPAEYNNAWQTGYAGYRPAGTNGHLFEMWDGEKVKPYAWVESDTGNSTDTVTYGAFERDESKYILKTDDANDRNYHFNGPRMSDVNFYTVKGKIKFDSSNAEFGINFYSQWPDEAKKYSIIRESDGLAYLYYIDGSTYTALDTLDTSSNDLISSTGDWYNYKIEINNSISFTLMKAKIWHDTSNEPDAYGISYDDGPPDALREGLVGVVSHDGDGYRYWGPISVISNLSDTGANMVYETFVEDTIVDVKPYIPRNWHPDYLYNQFVTGIDTTGFVLDTTGNSPSLVYRHKPGITYPTICRVIPETSLKWRDYEYSGTLIKPAGDSYDSLEVGAVFYMEGKDDYYKLVARGKGNGGNGFVIMKEDSVLDSLLGAVVFEGSVDTVNFLIRVQTEDIITDTSTIEDGRVSISADVCASGGKLELPTAIEDTAEDRKIEGYSGVIFDEINIESFTSGIKVRNVGIKKVIEQE